MLRKRTGNLGSALVLHAREPRIAEVRNYQNFSLNLSGILDFLFFFCYIHPISKQLSFGLFGRFIQFPNFPTSASAPPCIRLRTCNTDTGNVGPTKILPSHLHPDSGRRYSIRSHHRKYNMYMYHNSWLSLPSFITSCSKSQHYQRSGSAESPDYAF